MPEENPMFGVWRCSCGETRIPYEPEDCEPDEPEDDEGRCPVCGCDWDDEDDDEPID